MKKPVLLVVMDGVGFSKTGLGDAVTLANTPTLDYLLANYPNVKFVIAGRGPFMDELKCLAENLGIKVEVAHRALDDVDTTVKVFNIMMKMLKEKRAKTVADIDKDMVFDDRKYNFDEELEK